MSLRFYAVIAGNSVEQIDNLLDERNILVMHGRVLIFTRERYMLVKQDFKTLAERLELFKREDY